MNTEEGLPPGLGRSSASALVLSSRADTRAFWFRTIWRYRGVLAMLARKDFQVRYKRASLGVAWAVAVPIMQAGIMAVVFSHVVRTGSGKDFTVYVISGVLAYTYFSGTLTMSSTAIVDASSLTDKVWFPRILLPLVPCLTNLVSLITTLIFMMAVMPVFHVDYSVRNFLLIPSILFLVFFTAAISVVLASLHVYFRDVRFLVQATLLVLIYATPVVYTPRLLGRLAFLVEANPLTGIIGLFRLATIGNSGPTLVELAISGGATIALVVAGTEAARRHDRLFVDLL